MSRVKLKCIIIISVIIVFLLGGIGLLKYINVYSNGYIIYIANNTDKTITNLEIRYKVGDSITIIPEIKSNKSWEEKIDTNSIQGENSIILIYRDNVGNSYEETIVGYLEKGYSGQNKVTINEIDETGKLEIKVK